MVWMRTLSLMGGSAAKSLHLRLSLLETLYSSNSPPTMKALEPDSASAMKYTAQVSENTHTVKDLKLHMHTNIK